MAKLARWVWGLVGIVLGAATLVNAVRSGFAIELSGLPSKVIAQYVWARDMVFLPVAWVLQQIGVHLAWWVKDGVVAYGLVAAAFARSHDLIVTSGGSWDSPDRLLGFDAPRRKWVYALLWPVWVEWLRRKVRSVERFRAWIGPHGRPKITRLEEEKSTAIGARRQVRWIALNLLAVVVVTAAFFLWSYVQSAFGPPA